MTAHCFARLAGAAVDKHAVLSSVVVVVLTFSLIQKMQCSIQSEVVVSCRFDVGGII